MRHALHLIYGVGEVNVTKITPACEDDAALLRAVQCAKDQASYRVGIATDQVAAESHVDRRLTLVEESNQARIGGPTGRFIQEPVACDVDIMTPIGGCAREERRVGV
jgi:hypothetical protein